MVLVAVTMVDLQVIIQAGYSATYNGVKSAINDIQIGAPRGCTV